MDIYDKVLAVFRWSGPPRCFGSVASGSTKFGCAFQYLKFSNGLDVHDHQTNHILYT